MIIYKKTYRGVYIIKNSDSFGGKNEKFRGEEG